MSSSTDASLKAERHLLVFLLVAFKIMLSGRVEAQNPCASEEVMT